MNHALFIYNAAILDESLDGPGAVLIVEGKIRSVFQGYFTGAEITINGFEEPAKVV